MPAQLGSARSAGRAAERHGAPGWLDLASNGSIWLLWAPWLARYGCPGRSWALWLARSGSPGRLWASILLRRGSVFIDFAAQGQCFVKVALGASIWCSCALQGALAASIWRSGPTWGDLGRPGAHWSDLGRSRTIWGDLARSGADLGRSGAICGALGRSTGDLARFGVIWSDLGRSGATWADLSRGAGLGRSRAVRDAPLKWPRGDPQFCRRAERGWGKEERGNVPFTLQRFAFFTRRHSFYEEDLTWRSTMTVFLHLKLYCVGAVGDGADHNGDGASLHFRCKN